MVVGKHGIQAFEFAVVVLFFCAHFLFLGTSGVFKYT